MTGNYAGLATTARDFKTIKYQGNKDSILPA